MRSSRLTALLLSLALSAAAVAQHTYPLNNDPIVHDGYQHFYNLDYDGALQRFDQVLKSHPQDPMAVDYVLMGTIFRDLYRNDLLDTTLYAHEGFLTSKRQVAEDPATRARIEQLTRQAIDLSDQRLKINSNDKDAYFTRGYARSMHATFIGLTDHAFVSGLHQALQARSDNEKVLQLDPDYADAKMIVGIHQFAVASLPGYLRIPAGVFGVSGNREKGLQYLHQSADHGTITSVESRTTISLFLRHDARYQEALTVQHALARDYPHDFLFRLEEANITKDMGQGPQAIAIYKQVIADGQKKAYFAEPRLQLAWFGLAETERGQNDLQHAADAYLAAAAQPTCSEWLRRRSQLNAGEVFDLLHQRDAAIKQYNLASAGGGDQTQAEAARRYAQHPYSGK